MPYNDPTDPHEASIISQSHNAPFANRAIMFLFGLVAVVIFLGFAFFWPFASDRDYVSVDGEIISGQETNSILTSIDPDTGEEVGVLAKVFNDAVRGIDVDRFDMQQSPVDQARFGGSPAAKMAQLEAYYDRAGADGDDGYRQSFNDVLNSNVTDSKGDKSGELHDIIINKETGEARAVIISEDDQLFDNEFAALKFTNVRSQEVDGDIQMAITETRLDQKREFDYGSINNDKFISLKSLRNGQIVDDQGKYVGEIDALIYQNAEVQDIYFLIKPSLVSAGEDRLFKMPYERIDLVKSANGYDVQLSTEDTKALATALYTN